jgi:altronate dehydratase small subunit
MSKKVIIMNPKDNVATALVDLPQGEQVNASLDQISVDVTTTEPIQFAHKIALRDISQGEEIIKYGMPIGKATLAIRKGEWVHVHNCRSHRWGFQNDQYGLKA